MRWFLLVFLIFFVSQAAGMGTVAAYPHAETQGHDGSPAGSLLNVSLGSP